MRLIKWFRALAVLKSVLACAAPCLAQTSPQILHDLAPTGSLRAAINYGNSVLAQKDKPTGQPQGISADLARALAGKLGVPVTFVPFESAGSVFGALSKGVWDVAFLAVDPARAVGIDFTAPYVVIEGAYMVAKDSPVHAIADVDQPGVRIAVGKGSAYDLYLTRALHRATLVRAATSPAALDLFVTDHLDVAANVKNPLADFAKSHPDYRVVPERFMAIEQAMGTPKGRTAGAHFLGAFVEDMKASGFVAKAIAASGQADATVAPATTAERAAPVFSLSSPDLADNAMLQLKNAGNDKTNPNCAGANVSPAFLWSNPPAGTKSFAFLMFDPEGRNGLGVSHQVAYGIPPAVTHLDEGALSESGKAFVQGKGTRGFDVYYGPCPPPGTGFHHFIFTVLASDLAPDALPPGLTREQLFDKLQGHAKGVSGLVGRYRQ